MKKWGRGEYWGVSSNFDLDWLLTPGQRMLRDDLMELCRVKIRPHAAYCDKEYVFPRKSLNALSELGLLSLIVPKELGGLGENHVCCAMVVETLARYGCPSTAMIFSMHLDALAIVLMRYHHNTLIKDLLSRINKDKLIGTTSFSDPATGGHCWVPLSSKAQQVDNDNIKMLKYGSWVTSAGHADWYVLESARHTIVPGDYTDTSCFVVFKDEIRAHTEDWRALGMHGNMSGPVVVEGTFSVDRVVGQPGECGKLREETTSTYFLLNTSSCWNGIALGCMDIARKHVTHKTLADVGMRVADYPSIQDYFGKAICDVNASRAMTFMLAKQYDLVTNDNDFSIFIDPKEQRRAHIRHWGWQTKHTAAKMVSRVSDMMMQATGGTGYKIELGLERLFRDSRAGWVMSPSNELCRQLLGQVILNDFTVLENWGLRANERVLQSELKKMTEEQKKELAKSLVDEVRSKETWERKYSFQDSDFDNPFNICPPAVNDKVIKSSDGVSHAPALNPYDWTPVKLLSQRDISSKLSSFTFALPNPTDHTGCIAGQYIDVRVKKDGREHTRYFSPVTLPDDFGKIELVLKNENQGIISQYFKALKPGDVVEMRGPCGGFEYEGGVLEELTLMASGGGITPCLQLVRQVMANPKDKTAVLLIYFAENYDDILYKEELDNYQVADKRLKVVYTLGDVPENWEGHEGYIDKPLISKHVPPVNGKRSKIIMCGGTQMTLMCLHSLHSLGFPSNSIFIYGQFGTNQVQAIYGRRVKMSTHRCRDN